MSEIRDLEEELVLAAADADSRNYNENILHETETKSEELLQPEEAKDVSLKRHYSVEPKVSSSSLKRRHDDEEEVSVKVPRGYANVVAKYYNQLEEKGVGERFKSRIFYLRNFHNWIKSMLIAEYLSKIRQNKKHNEPIRVHDMCCGKGGDLLKWKNGSITHLICSDIAEVSIDQCKARYNEMKNRTSRSMQHLYSIEYIFGDCTRMRLREKYSDPLMKLDLVSCQFAFHYSFESLPQAECMLRNAAECLRPGGFFIGTIPDANELVARAKRSRTNKYGNKVYQVFIDFDINKPPLFGSKYNFQLDGVVDCPEFLVHFPTLVKLAKKFGLKLVTVEKFHDFFNRKKDEGKRLLNYMRSLESYPPPDSSMLVGTDVNDYIHAEEFIEHQGIEGKIGTLSKSEWEASSIYTTFVFEKVKNTWNADGTPCYDI